MNDSELDEILDQWKVEAPADGLRLKVRAGFEAVQGSRTLPVVPVRRRFGFGRVVRRALMAAALVVAGVFVFTAVQALSQTTPDHIPYMVDSEYLRYGHDGPEVAMLTTSYTASNGSEVILSRTVPGHPFYTGMGRTLDAVLPAWQQLILPFVVSPKNLALYRKKRQEGFQQIVVVSGCGDWNCLFIAHWGFQKAVGGVGVTACLEGTVVGTETILGHPTTAVQTRSRPERLTMWLAPDLGCFPMRINSEVMRPDGSFHVWQTKQAVKVTMTP